MTICKVMSITVLIEARNKLYVLDQTLTNVFPLGFEISSAGPAGDHHGDCKGRFETIIGEDKDGFPVYQQAHSKEIPSEYNYLLYR